MRDYRNTTFQRKKPAVNKVKVQRKPIEWGKYLRPLGKIALGVSAVALAVGVVYGIVYGTGKAIGSARFFSLKTIEVASAKRLNEAEILALAGVEPGQNLARMNLKRIGEQLAQNPWVETVRVHRYFPDRLSIAITEREPLAIVNMGLIYYLDKKGNVFKVLNQGDNLDYPVVTGFSEEDVTGNPVATKNALQSTCELLAILREKGAFILADVSEIHYDKGYGFTLFTSSGSLPIKIGAGDFAAKVDRFARIYRDLMAQRPSLQYIDLDYNDKIVVKKS